MNFSFCLLNVLLFGSICSRQVKSNDVLSSACHWCNIVAHAAGIERRLQRLLTKYKRSYNKVCLGYSFVLPLFSNVFQHCLAEYQTRRLDKLKSAQFKSCLNFLFGQSGFATFYSRSDHMTNCFEEARIFSLLTDVIVVKMAPLRNGWSNILLLMYFATLKQ